MNRIAARLVAAATIGGICWLFPPVHVVPLKTVAAQTEAAKFNPAYFAANFWTNQLLPALDKAVKADALLPAIETDAAAAKRKFSRHVGLSDSYFYFLRGAGNIVSISDDAIVIATTSNSTNAEIALQTGLIFGDAIRDGTGLLNASDYPNSQDFNDISAALNHMAEVNVLPELRKQAKTGARISFVGCAEVDDESTDLKPLKVIPIQTKSE